MNGQKRDLTPKQKRFVEEYLIDLNATQAAIRAGYSPKTANAQAGRMLVNVSIQEEIQRQRNKRSERTEIKQDHVLKELASIGFSRYTDIVNIRRGVIFVRDTEELPDSVKAAISSIRYNADGAVEVKLCDKNKALELIGRHLGMFDGNTGSQDALAKLDSILREVHENAFKSEAE